MFEGNVPEPPPEWKASLDDLGLTEHFKEMEIPSSIDAVLADGNWEVVFNAYAKTNFQVESTDFIRSVGAYEQSGDVGTAREIYHRFVAEGSPAQVNLSGAHRSPLDEAFGGGEDQPVPPDVFDGAKAAIIAMMAADVFPRFVTEAKAYQESLWASHDWDAGAGRGRSGGGDAPLPADYPAAAPPPPPPPDDDDDDIVPPPPGADDNLPPLPEDDDDIPPPPPPGASRAPSGRDDDDIPPPPPPSPAP